MSRRRPRPAAVLVDFRLNERNCFLMMCLHFMQLLVCRSSSVSNGRGGPVARRDPRRINTDGSRLTNVSLKIQQLVVWGRLAPGVVTFRIRSRRLAIRQILAIDTICRCIRSTIGNRRPPHTRKHLLQGDWNAVPGHPIRRLLWSFNRLPTLVAGYSPCSQRYAGNRPPSQDICPIGHSACPLPVAFPAPGFKTADHLSFEGLCSLNPLIHRHLKSAFGC